MIALGYRNVFFHEQESNLGRKSSDKPGWYSTRDSKNTLLSEYRRALGTEFKNPSKEALSECREYIYWATGAIEHSRAMRSIDPQGTAMGTMGARLNHGDLVIADALDWKLLKEYHVKPEVKAKKAGENCFAGRRELHDEKRRAVSFW